MNTWRERLPNNGTIRAVGICDHHVERGCQKDGVKDFNDKSQKDNDKSQKDLFGKEFWDWRAEDLALVRT
jgi:hypothetical protein